MQKNKQDKKRKEALALEDKLLKENTKIKILTEIEENTAKLNKSITRCLNLLQESMKGPEIDIMFNEMHNSSNSYYKKISSSLENELLNATNEMSRLRKKQEDLEEETIKEKVN